MMQKSRNLDFLQFYKKHEKNFVHCKNTEFLHTLDNGIK